MAEAETELPDRVEVEQARLAVARREVQVIDVRDADEFAEERIFGSAHADPDVLEEAIDGDGPVLVVCGDGERSAEIAERLRGDGRQASSLEGGFAAWTKEHLPTAPGRDEEYEGPEVKVPGAVASETEPDEDEENDEDETREGDGAERDERA
jgi:rhodanese-related sulfurtransferase